ncbi:MAG: TonB-dependent receptor plug [Bacteroidetes bacterium]|nr:TonB-dependent receptor plug [Bacteroidota bacterium]
MKKIIYVFISAFMLCMITDANAFTFGSKTSLSGKITDKQTGQTLPGVSIFIPDLKTGTVSNVDGTYLIENLPQSKVLIQISFIGYKTIIETLDLSQLTTKDYAMETSVKEMNEVVVTGLSQAGEKNRTATPISLISKTQLLQNASTNIIDAIAKQPGISQVTTGSGISKPVIRGLGYNRVVVVNDGIRQEGQQWGDEHGIEIDEFSVSKVEILKGPASLSYGSDAIAGVINFLTAPTLPEGKIAGNVVANYQTNNGLFGYSANVAGNIKGFIWDLRYSNKMAHSYQNKYDGYVFNSGYKENNVSGIIGVNKSWGYSHLHFSMYELTPGIVEGERDSATGKFVKPIAVNDSTEGSRIATNSDFKSYTPSTPFQEIRHYKAVLNNSFVIGNGSLKATLGFQQNRRQEYGNILTPDAYGLYFLLNTINYDVRYVLPEKNNWNVSFGANGMQQTSQNKGIEFLVPEYNLFDVGVFTIVRKSFEKLDISGGIRYDSRTEHSKDLFLDANGVKTDVTTGTYHQFTAFNSQFSGISGSLGATYQFNDKVFAKVNAARGYRAPSIGEVGANGVHDGTTRYEIGDPKLKAENSLQVDAAFGINTTHVTAEVDVFDNSIDNFIFARKLSSVGGGDSITQGYSTFKFVSGNANLMGGEIMIDIHPHPLDWLHFENSFSYVNATQKHQPDSTKYLPFTPAPKIQSELRADIKKLGKVMTNAYVKVEAENYFEQNHFYSAYGTETKTPGYTLFNVGIGGTIISKDRTICSIYISANNITDVAYQSHLSRLKYEDMNNVTGRTGVYNMGRNISFKLMVPLNFKK